MLTFHVTRRVQAPAERVWALATDLARAPEVVSDIDAVQVLTPGPFGVGTRWRETRTMLGRPATEEMTVTAVDPGRSYTAEADSHGTHYVSTFAFVPVTDSACAATDVTMTFSGQPAGAMARTLARLTAPLARRAVQRTLRSDLDDLAAAAERG